MKKIIIFILLMGVAIFLSANNCFAYLTHSYDTEGGFLWGIWDGLITPITLPLNVLFPQSVNVYNSNNNGLLYNVGFVIPAIGVCETSIPLLIIAWILKLSYIFIIFIMVGLIALGNSL